MLRSQRYRLRLISNESEIACVKVVNDSFMNVNRCSFLCFLILFTLPMDVLSQQSRTTTADGNFNDPNVWSPIGVPTNGENLNINHNLVMTSDIYYTAGQIYLGSGGTLTDNGNHAFWVGSGGTLYMNGGTLSCHLLRFSPNTTAHLYASYFNVDTLWNQETTIGGTIHINANYFLNDTAAHWWGSGILNITDSLVNRGIFENGNTLNVGSLYNEGIFNNAFSVQVSNNLYNCNNQGGNAIIDNDLLICVEGDLLNCAGNTLDGNGEFFTGGTFTNNGDVTGNLELLSPSGVLAVPGTLGTGVTVGVGACSSSLEEASLHQMDIHPNPTDSDIQLSVSGVGYQLFNPLGQLVRSGTIENSRISLTDLESGIYSLVIEGYQVRRVVKR